MSCAADRGDFPAWTGKVVEQQEEITPEVDANELTKRIMDYFFSGDLAPIEIELKKALDQEFRRGVEEALALTRPLLYRPLTPEEPR